MSGGFHRAARPRPGGVSNWTVSVAAVLWVGAAVHAPPTEAAPSNYTLASIETMTMRMSGAATAGHVPGASQLSYSGDGQWIYYAAPCTVYASDGAVFQGCPIDPNTAPGQPGWAPAFPNGRPDLKSHVRRVRLDGTGDECLTCGTYNDGVYWNRHSGMPEVRPQNDYMAFQKERPNDIPPGTCGAGSTGPGGGLYNDLWVMRLSDRTITELYHAPTESPGAHPAHPGTLEPRWDPSGTKLLWAQLQTVSAPATSTRRFGDWKMRVAHFVPAGVEAWPNNTPHLHGVSYTDPDGAGPLLLNLYAGGHGTTPVAYDPSPSGIYITNGFTVSASGALSGVYFANPGLGTSQSDYANDGNAMAFANPWAQARLTKSSGLNGEGAYYEEFFSLNQRYWDVMAYMTTEPYGTPEGSCFLDSDSLRTDIWFENPSVADPYSTRSRQTWFTDYTQDWQGQNPTSCYTGDSVPTPPPNGHCRVVVSKVTWAPNGLDIAATVVYVKDEDTDDSTAGRQMHMESRIKLLHYTRL